MEVSASAFDCHHADRRCVWVKEGSYRPQIRVSARYEAIMIIDNELHVPDAGQVKVEAQILYLSFFFFFFWLGERGEMRHAP